MKLSFIIPCYRSENTIGRVLDEIKETVEGKEDIEYEVIMINDCSPDNVWEKIVALSRTGDNIHGINFTMNYGQHAAIMAGFKYATGDLIVNLDDDGQTPVCEVFKLIDKLNEGYDIVFGSYPQMKQNGFRKFGSRVNIKMSEIMLNWPKDVYSTSFFVVKQVIVKEMIRYENAYPYLGGLITRTTRKISNVDVTQRERLEGKSGYNLRKLLNLWINGFTTFSLLPLRFASYIGMICSALGFIFGIVVIIRKLINPDIILGYSSLLAVFLFIGGIVMLMLGIIGEYVGRIYISINNAPQYVIRETTYDYKK